MKRVGIYIARIFIDVFGITHPSAQQERMAAIFINSLLLLTLVFCIALGYLFFRVLH